MLIEAARGGHTSVVNLLLRQPLMKRRQLLDQASLSSENRKLSMSGRKHATPSTASGSAATAPAAQGGKPLTSTLQHIPQEQSLPSSQAVQVNPDTTSGATSVTSSQQASTTSSTGSTDSNADGNTPGTVHLQHQANSNVAQKPSKLTSQQQGGGGVQQQQPLVICDASEKASARKVSQGSAGSAGTGEGRDLIGAKRPKMSSADPSLPTTTQSTVMTTPTKQPPIGAESDLPYMATPPHLTSDAPSAFSPGHYTTDSATALKNMQRLTSNANSPLKSGTVSNEVGSSVDATHLLHTQTNMVNSSHVNSGDVTLASAQLTPDDIIQGHMTADDIIARYWRQLSVSSEASKLSTTSPTNVSSCSSSVSNANGTKDTITDSSAQRMFSSGNFSTLPSPKQAVGSGRGYHSIVGVQPEDPQSLMVNSLPTGDLNSSQGSSNITQAPGVDSHPLSNMDLTRLIPHLEALAGSLQNPSSFESHYLAALAAQSQLIHPSVSSNDSSGELPADIGDEKMSLPHSMGALDPSTLLSAAEIAKLLPNIANFESQSDSADFEPVSSSTVTSSTGSQSQPIYPTSLSTLRHLSQKLQAHTPSSEVGPDPGGGGDAGMEEDENEIDVDLLQQIPARSLPPSLLLDSKFPLDIPPPNDLIPAENVSKAFDDV